MKFVNCTTLVVEVGFNRVLNEKDFKNTKLYLYSEKTLQELRNLFNQNYCDLKIIFDINRKEDNQYIYNANVIAKNDKFANLTEQQYDKIINKIIKFAEKINK